MILAIDYDGVIHDRANPVEGRKLGPPLPGAVEALDDLHAAGHTIIVHTLMATTPSGTRVVEDWLDYYGIEHHGVTAIKPAADFYIDDKAIRHTSWPDTLQQIGFNDDF
jgi:phosphoglycolate phosphatase-like HAD superfamily hydrolase